MRGLSGSVLPLPSQSLGLQQQICQWRLAERAGLSKPKLVFSFAVCWSTVGWVGDSRRASQRPAVLHTLAWYCSSGATIGRKIILSLYAAEARCGRAIALGRNLEVGDLAGDTIIGVPFDSHPLLQSLLQNPSEDDEWTRGETSRRAFKIRSADSSGQRSSASILIDRMYATRGYLTSPLPSEQLPTRITLVASEHDATIGTITIGFDSPAGLHVDDPFAEETRDLRAEGRKICEFTKLAIDSVVRSKRVLASLFHVAYIYAHRMMGFDSLLIEVNPRHVRYYERMLGFNVFGQKRLNRRVNAPAVLLCLDFAHAADCISRFGGRPEFSADERSLYPFFFSVTEEANIVGRLMRTQPDAAYTHGRGAATLIAPWTARN